MLIAEVIVSDELLLKDRYFAIHNQKRCFNDVDDSQCLKDFSFSFTLYGSKHTMCIFISHSKHRLLFSYEALGNFSLSSEKVLLLTPSNKRECFMKT